MTNHTPDVPHKQCPKCDKLLPATGEFWATDKSKPDGLFRVCKACHAKRKQELKVTESERKARKEAGLKLCPGCKKELPATLEYFYQEPRRKTLCFKTPCKSCLSIKSKATPVSEKSKETARKYSLAHKEQGYEKHRRWRLRNLERERKKEREHKRNDPKHSQRARDWERNNPEKFQKQRANYRAKASDKLRLILQRYVARKARLPDDYTEQDWQFALDYFGHLCPVCASTENLQADHWIPLSNEQCPGTIPHNIAVLCSACNQSKNNRDPETWLTKKLGKSKAKEVLAKIHEFFSKVRQV